MTESKLWLLRPVEDLTEDDPWEPWYDKAFGFVVRAETEKEAREFAHAEAGDENRGEFKGLETPKERTPWLDEKYSTCVTLYTYGEEGIIIRDFAAA